MVVIRGEVLFKEIHSFSFFYVVNLFKTPASNTDCQSKTQSNVDMNQHVVIEKNTAIFQIQIVQKLIKCFITQDKEHGEKSDIREASVFNTPA